MRCRTRLLDPLRFSALTGRPFLSRGLAVSSYGGRPELQAAARRGGGGTRQARAALTELSGTTTKEKKANVGGHTGNTSPSVEGGGGEAGGAEPTNFLSKLVRAMKPCAETRTRRKERASSVPGEKKELSWDEYFQQLLSYRREQDDWDPPFKSSYYPGLSQWLAKQRGLRFLKKLDKEKEARLAAIGIPWISKRSRSIISWDTHYQALRDFKMRFGHTKVPRMWEENVALSLWVHNQRVAFKKKKLDRAHISMLDKIQFAWMPTQKQWYETLEKLYAFKAEHGHLDVAKWKPSVPTKLKEAKSLSKWARKQRWLYRAGKLKDQEKINALNDLGFDLKPQVNVVWWANAKKAEAYKKANTTIRGLYQYPLMYSWIRNARTKYRKGALSPEQAAMVEKLGILNDARLMDWETNFAKLKERHGDSSTPALAQPKASKAAGPTGGMEGAGS